MLDLRLLVRTAQRLHQIYCDRSVTAIHEALQSCFSQIPGRVNEMCRSVSSTVADGKPLSIVSFRRHAGALNRQFRIAVGEACTQLQRSTKPVPNLRFFFDELRQLDDEFEGLEIGLKQKFLRVSTEPIILEEVPLGRFHNLSICDQCENEFCSECIGCCDLCDRNACGACRERCTRCRKHCCSHCRNRSAHSERLCCSECLRECSVCGQQVASDELADDGQTCRPCQADDTPDEQIDSSPLPQENAHEPGTAAAV